MKKIKPESIELLRKGEIYTFETFRWAKNLDDKLIAKSDQYIDGILINISNKWQIFRKKDITGSFFSERLLVWDSLIFKPLDDIYYWSETEKLKIHQKVITTGFFQVWCKNG